MKDIFSVLLIIFMGVIGTLFIILLMTGGKPTNQIILEKIEKIEQQQDSSEIGLKFYTNDYNGHQYVICTRCESNGSQMCMVHSPDCQCFKKDNENDKK